MTGPEKRIFEGNQESPKSTRPTASCDVQNEEPFDTVSRELPLGDESWITRYSTAATV